LFSFNYPPEYTVNAFTVVNASVICLSEHPVTQSAVIGMQGDNNTKYYFIISGALKQEEIDM